MTLSLVRTWGGEFLDYGGAVYNVRHPAFGAVGDDVANDGAAIAAAITAAPAGSVVELPPGTYRITAAIAVAKALTFVGPGVIHQVTSGQNAFSVTASNVKFRNLTLTGPQFAVSAIERGISAIGTSAAAPIAGLEVTGCKLTTWGQEGIYLKWVNDFLVDRNHIEDIYIHGILMLSCLRGRVANNLVRNVVATPNAYGIIMSREETDSLATDPHTADIVVEGNQVYNVALWTGIDTHGGQRLTIVGNTVKNCKVGVSIGEADNASNVATWSANYVTVTGNTIDSTLTTGAAGPGIQVTGADGFENATGVVITGNTVLRHGEAANAHSGAIYARNTSGLTIAGNVLTEPSPTGIVLYHDNYDFNIGPSTMVDAWTNTVGVGQGVGVLVSDDDNRGMVGGVMVGRGAKTATYINTFVLRIADYSGNDLVIGELAGQGLANTVIYDPGFRSTVRAFTASDTTPSVKRGKKFRCVNGSATSITNFDDGSNGDSISVLLDANTTLVHGAPMKLAGGANLVGTANDMVTLMLHNSVWYEQGRSVNG